jgi:HEPN domain-containing protein
MDAKESSIDMDEDIDYWLQLARLDLDSARKSLQGDSYLHCLFGCQQALEKLLKALVVEATEQQAPRVHNLVRLASLAGVTLKPVQENLLSTLSLQYIEMRYPEELATIDELNNRQTAEEHLQQTEKLFQWLEAQRK